MSWYLEAWKQYAVFSGRATRSEYWYFVLINVVAIVVLAIIDNALGIYPVFSGIYLLAVFVPSLALTIRRLHDTNRSGWWVLIGLIPLIGPIILIVFYAQDSFQGTTSFGQTPEGQSSANPTGAHPASQTGLASLGITRRPDRGDAQSTRSTDGEVRRSHPASRTGLASLGIGSQSPRSEPHAVAPSADEPDQPHPASRTGLASLGIRLRPRRAGKNDQPVTS